ncbi:MAG TPA: HNH endonuclease signature motif containing protein [bacterium]|nr:HNH endonuclease signature motif containing protein [bacterium]
MGYLFGLDRFQVARKVIASAMLRNAHVAPQSGHVGYPSGPPSSQAKRTFKRTLGLPRSSETAVVGWGMITHRLSDIKPLSDRDLLVRVEVLARREREATAALVAHLAELDARRLYLGEGCSTLFAYCMRVLHCSEYSAYRRAEAARVARRYPVILEMLATGSINLTTIRVLAPELTPANHQKLLEAAKHKGRHEVERLVAGLRPRPTVPTTIRQLPTRTASLVFHTPPKADTTGDQVAPLEAPTLEIRPPARPIVVPLTPERFKIQFTATRETHELLQRAQNLLRHQIPSGDAGEVIAKALKLLVRELEKEKIAATDRPRASHGADPSTRYIPAEVKRQVWKRDGGACAFVAPNGRRCNERGFLEFHHVDPYAVGGKATIDNIELRCRAHNGYEADQYFGAAGTGPN